MGLGGGQGRGFEFLGWGGGFAGEVLRELLRVGGLNRQLDRRISSSAHPSHQNSLRLAKQGVFTAHVSLKRERSHSRSPNKMAHPRWGLRSSSWYRADRGMLHVPAAHWWLSENVKLGLIWGSFVHCDVFVLVCCAFCMLGNVHLMFLEVLDTHPVKVQGRGYFFWRRLS